VEAVAVRVRALATGKLIFATSTSRLNVALPQSGAFEVDVTLQLNVPAGRYLCETVTVDRVQSIDLAMGPVVRLDVLEGKSFWGTVQMNPVMKLSERSSLQPAL